MVIGSVLLPPGIGLATGHWWPAARRGMLAIRKESSFVLALGFAAIIAVAWSQNGAVVRQERLTTLVVINSDLARRL